MSSEIAIEAQSISKVYLLYRRPDDRLRQMVVPSVKRLLSPVLGWLYPRLRVDKPRYQEFWALRDVSVQLRRGETLGIIGQNGSGKSTLLQIVCGTLTPTIGTTASNGRIAALLELGAGFNPEFTGRENVYLSAAIYGLGTAEVDARMQAIIDFAEIGEHIDQPVKTYSSGMFVRLAFSVIANVDADILVIDEALAVGDAYFQQKCMRFLRTFKETGSIFFVSHDTGAMMNFCDRVVWLDHGTIRAQGDPRVVCEEYLAHLYQQHTGAESETAPHASAAEASVDATVVVELNAPASDPNADGRAFGDRAAEIVSCALRDVSGRNLASVHGGEVTELVISFTAHEALTSVISGFIVKDRLGQYIFGDNTFAANAAAPLDMKAGETAQARFRFEMPTLAPGVYSVAVAVASGTLQDHVQHHWVHEGLVFNAHTKLETGVLIAIPMLEVELSRQ